MTKILFLDIDGPMIPGRCYTMAGQTKPFVMIFDPAAVGMINDLCKLRGWKIVLHSSWIRVYGAQKTYDHCVKQGILPEYFHEHAWCNEHEHWRYNRVARWLEAHPECEQYVILDDEPYAKDFDLNNPEHPKDIEKHLILIDFEDGLLSQHYRKLRDGAWKCNV